MNRRCLLSALVACLLLPAAASAQSYPNKPIKMIVPFPAGGPADLFARVLGNGLTAELGQQIIIENRAGVGGMAGVDALAKSAPDGYTIGLNGCGAVGDPFMVARCRSTGRRTLLYSRWWCACPKSWSFTHR